MVGRLAASATGNWQVATGNRLVYDGWNVIEVLNGAGGGATGPAENAVLTKYTWGLDLSGQRGNALTLSELEAALQRWKPCCCVAR